MGNPELTIGTSLRSLDAPLERILVKKRPRHERSCSAKQEANKAWHESRSFTQRVVYFI
jgi:hypothetical protein